MKEMFWFLLVGSYKAEYYISVCKGTPTHADITEVRNHLYGKIYIFFESKGELQTDGFQFETRTDTEVLLNSY